MTSLINWYFEEMPDKTIILHGVVTGHGTFIKTKPITQFIEYENELIVYTNKTKYKLLYKYCDKRTFKRLKPTRSNLDVIASIDSRINNALFKKRSIINDLKRKMEPKTLFFFNDEIDLKIAFKNEFGIFAKLEEIRTDSPGRWEKHSQDHHYPYEEFDYPPKKPCVPPAYAVLTDDYSTIIFQYSIENSQIFFTQSLNEVFDNREIPEGTLLGYLVNDAEKSLEVTFSWGKQLTAEPHSAYKIFYNKDEERFSYQ